MRSPKRVRRPFLKKGPARDGRPKGIFFRWYISFTSIQTSQAPLTLPSPPGGEGFNGFSSSPSRGEGGVRVNWDWVIQTGTSPFFRRLAGALPSCLAALALWAFTPAVSVALGPVIDGAVYDASRGGAMEWLKEGEFLKAEQAEEKALKIAEEYQGPLHPDLISLYDDLGTLHRYMARYAEAEKEYQWGLALLGRNFGPGDPRAADSLEMLAALYADQARWEEAEWAARRALALRQAHPPQDPVFMAQSLELSGRIALGRGQASQAADLFRQALEWLGKSTQAPPGFSGTLGNDLAQALELVGDLPGAQDCLEKALDGAQKEFPGRVEAADGMERLADFYRLKLRQPEKAAPLYSSAFKIYRGLVGTYFGYSSLPYMEKLAEAYEATGDGKASEKLWSQCLGVEKGVYGPQHPQVALGLIQLAETESGLKEYGRARENLKQSLAILRLFFGENHPLVLRADALLQKLPK